MNALRQMQLKEQRWSDKSAKKHKHHYVKHCIVKVVGKLTTYHDVMMCDCCSSFIAIQHKGSFCGLVDVFDENLPVFVFERTKNTIGFDGIRRLYGEENT